MVVVVALKVAVVAAAATVTDAGTVSVVLVFVKATVAPPAGAACVKVTVQVLVPFGPKLAGAHVNDDTSAAGACTVIVPPVPVIAVPVPPGNVATDPVTEIGTVEPPGADPSPTVTVATAPLAIVAAFMPMAMHITVPVPALQVRVFPAAVSADPAVTVMDPMLPGA